MTVYFVGVRNPTTQKLMAIKIGYTSRSVESRLTGIQTGSFLPLEVLVVLEEGTRATETSLHWQFRHSLTMPKTPGKSGRHWEWFWPVTALTDLIHRLSASREARDEYVDPSDPVEICDLVAASVVHQRPNQSPVGESADTTKEDRE